MALSSTDVMSSTFKCLLQVKRQTTVTQYRSSPQTDLQYPVPPPLWQEQPLG